MKVAGFTQGGPQCGAHPRRVSSSSVILSGFESSLSSAASGLPLHPRRARRWTRSLDRLAKVLEPDDIVVDGGNSYWGDSIRRHARLRERGIHLVDVGTSGGVDGRAPGRLLHGRRRAPSRWPLEPILQGARGPRRVRARRAAGRGPLRQAGAQRHRVRDAAGDRRGHRPAGARYPDRLDIPACSQCWRNGSVIRSWLVDLLEEAYRRRARLWSASSRMSRTPAR